VGGQRPRHRVGRDDRVGEYVSCGRECEFSLGGMNEMGICSDGDQNLFDERLYYTESEIIKLVLTHAMFASSDTSGF
jgi:hypothetical protein